MLHLLLSVTYVIFEYCDIKIGLFIPCEKEINVKCCLLKLKYQMTHSGLHKSCLNIEKVILARSGAHMIDDIAFKYESNLSRC